MRRALILPTVTILLLLGLCIANGLLLRQHPLKLFSIVEEFLLTH